MRQKQFEYAHLFGAVCPASGATEALIVSFLIKDVMIKHLAQISAATAKGRFAVVVMNGAGWHTDDIADEFDNLAMLKLPPYSPELNPIEQVWSWLQQHHLANRCFENYEAIVEAYSEAWKSFISDSRRVIKMCS